MNYFKKRSPVEKLIHDSICSSLDRLQDWFDHRIDNLFGPIYSSFDIRSSVNKISCIDANIYPSGFNNICQEDKKSSISILNSYLEKKYPRCQNILILTEEHTNNIYYWEHIKTLCSFFYELNKKVTLAFPQINERKIVQLISGSSIEILPLKEALAKNDYDLIINNNDFSNINNLDILSNQNIPIDPPYEFGWYKRKKHHFFNHYNELAKEFSQIIGINPWLMRVKTSVFKNFDINEINIRESLAEKVETEINYLKHVYKELNFSYEPSVFVKNNSGTYGLGVIHAKNGDDILKWNYKAKKKMKASKGGKKITELIIQEAIPSFYFTEAKETAEPVIYMIGRDLSGGFLRTHAKKGPYDNLNSPGTVYKRLCISDMKINREDCPLENIYGWISKIALLAICYEFKGE